MADKSSLDGWKTKLAIEWCVEHWTELGTRSDQSAYYMARSAADRFRDDRAQVGTGVHETIEAIHTGSWEYPALDDEQLQIMAQWDKLNKAHKITPILSEYTVWNKGLYAGTADGFWDIDGVKTGIDVKTSKSTHPEHLAQLAAIINAPVYMHEKALDVWEEIPNPEYEAAALIHLRADKWEIIPVTNIELHFQAFMGYHSVWDAKQQLKKIEKEAKL